MSKGWPLLWLLCETSTDWGIGSEIVNADDLQLTIMGVPHTTCRKAVTRMADDWCLIEIYHQSNSKIINEGSEIVEYLVITINR